MAAQSGLAVVLLNWRDEQATLRCAASLQGWRAVNPVVVIVDNESTAAGHAALRQGAGAAVLIRSAANLGFGGGNNLGIRWALERGFDDILLLNTDARIAEDGVVALLNRLREHSDIAVLGPVLRDTADGANEYRVGGRDIARHRATHVALDPSRLRGLPGDPLHDVDYVPGTVLLTRRSVLETAGVFEERYFFSGETADLCRRIRAAGGRACIDLDVLAMHDTQHASPALRDTLYVYYSLRNRFLFVGEYPVAKRLCYRLYWAMIGTWELMKSLGRCRFDRARALRLAVLHGLAGKFGNQNSYFIRTVARPLGPSPGKETP